MTPPSPDVRPGSLARCTDGPGGLIERPIVSPRTDLLTHIVVERPGAPDTYWIVPATEIAAVQPDAVLLTISRQELNGHKSHRRHQGQWLTADPTLPPVSFPDRRADAAVAAAVRETLQADPVVGSGEVEVEVDDGLVTIKGQVPTGLGRLAAQKLAEQVPGVFHVRNALQSDEEAAVAINRRLLQEDEIRRYAVRARVEGGRVFWQHREAPPAILSRATALARAVPGVREIPD